MEQIKTNRVLENTGFFFGYGSALLIFVSILYFLVLSKMLSLGYGYFLGAISIIYIVAYFLFRRG